jgi:hypothetical protein
MSTPLGAYTAKILKEHPLAIWSLEDQADYVDILTDSNRDLSFWDEDTATVSEESSPPSFPIVGQKVYRIVDSGTTVGEIKNTKLESQEVGLLQDLDTELANFSISTFLYSETSDIRSATIGFSYVDDTFGLASITKKFPVGISGKWLFLSETFDIPQGVTGNYKVFIEVEHEVNSGLDPANFLVSSYSFGQWSEEFSATSTGVVPENILDSVHGISATQKTVKLLSISDSNSDGYILSNGTRLYARNFGMPLVFGLNASTTIYPNESMPSLIIPGLGFLNESGKNKNYTLEFWMRIDPKTTTEKRIFGPVASTDGVYVDGPFLKLKIGNHSKAHFVGEWYRPMLVHIVYGENEISLLVNGEISATIAVDRKELSFPASVVDEKQADWLGFYSYEETTPFEINSISLYSYLVSSTIAKRRWVFGQAVDNPEPLNTAYGGKSVVFDYEFSKFSNGYSYPKNGGWESGENNNFSIEKNRLAAPAYLLPKIVSTALTQNEVLDLAFLEQDSGESFLKIPEGSHLYFEKLNNISDRLESIHATFSLTEDEFSPQSLLFIRDRSTGNSLSVDISPDTISYTLVYAGSSETFITNSYTYSENKFSMGISLDSMSNYFGNNLSKFLSNRDSLELFVAGGPGKNSFSGKIYSISFCNSFAYKPLSEYFSNKGVSFDTELDISFTGLGLPQIASGSLVVKPYVTSEYMYLDFSADCSWTSFIPLSYFGKYVKDSRGNDHYDVDSLQFNVGYPALAPLERIEQTTESWTYQELNFKFASPVQKRYSDLDNFAYTGYVDYLDLQYNSQQTFRYNTDSSLVKTYIYFKNVSSGMANQAEYYSNIELLGSEKVVYPGEEWINTKYEVIDNTVIYPPTGEDFSTLSMFIEVVAKVDGVSTNPLAIDKLQIASMSLNNAYGTPVGTRYGVDVYPYSKNGLYYDFKSKNPFTIYKGSTPHLYLGKNNGVELVGQLDSYASRGIEIPINVEQSQNYKMIALKFFAKFDGNFFPYSPTEVLEIESAASYLKFFIQATNLKGTRAKIYAINVKTGKLENGIAFYVNGKIVKDGILTLKQWSFIGIGISNPIDFSLSTGAIRITGPLAIDNVSFYKSANLQKIQRTSARPWIKVKEDGLLDFDWQYWQGLYTWFEVLVFASSDFYGVDPSEIYKSYVGTSKITVDDRSILRADRYRYRLFLNSVTNRFILNSV